MTGQEHKENWNITVNSPLWKGNLLCCPGLFFLFQLYSLKSYFHKMNFMLWIYCHQFPGKHPGMLQHLTRLISQWLRTPSRLEMFSKHRSTAVIVENIYGIVSGFNVQEKPSPTDITHPFSEKGKWELDFCLSPYMSELTTEISGGKKRKKKKKRDHLLC